MGGAPLYKPLDLHALLGTMAVARTAIALVAALVAAPLLAQAGDVVFERLTISDEADNDWALNLIGSDAEVFMKCTCESPGEYFGEAKYTSEGTPFDAEGKGLEIGDISEEEVKKCEDTDAITCTICRLAEGGSVTCTLTDEDPFTGDDILMAADECTVTYETFAESGNGEVTCVGVGTTGAKEKDATKLVLACKDCTTPTNSP